MRTADLVFAFPAILLAFVVTASLGKGLQNAVLALVIVSWPAYARVVRGLVLTIGDSEYVASARLLGASSRRTIVRDVLPNFIGPVIVLAMLEVAGAVLLLSGLSFLGLGAQPPTADWGGMAAEGVDYFQYWWMGTFPGIAIFTVVLAFNFVGDGLRDIFDPRVGQGPLMAALLEVENMTIRLPSDNGPITIVDGIDFSVEPGEIFGVAGESGSGKTMTTLALLRLLPPGAPVDGRAMFEGTNLLALKGRALREARGNKLSMVFQDPMTSLHPMLSIERQMTDHLKSHLGIRKKARAQAGDRAARRRAPPRPRACARVLSAPVLRRHAPADRDRHRARVPAVAADRGRADDRARRHRPGRDHRAARAPAPRARPRGDPDHARPRRDVDDRRPARRSSTRAASSSPARWPT